VGYGSSGWGDLVLGAVAAAFDEDGCDVVEEAVRDCGGKRVVVVEDLRLVFVGATGGEDCGRLLVATGQDLEQEVRARLVDGQVDLHIFSKGQWPFEAVGPMMIASSAARRFYGVFNGFWDAFEQFLPTDGLFWIEGPGQSVRTFSWSCIREGSIKNSPSSRRAELSPERAKNGASDNSASLLEQAGDQAGENVAGAHQRLMWCGILSMTYASSTRAMRRIPYPHS